ncbi:MAG: hypothetical protein ACR2KX_05830 [Chitinophagaceae bacterium]
MKDNVTAKARVTGKKKFLYYFPKGFSDAKYYSWERGYKWETHLAWERDLNKEEYLRFLSKKKYTEIALELFAWKQKQTFFFPLRKWR